MNIVIENEFLSVEIGQSGSYVGTRFDWTGFIRQVTMKDKGHTFCTVESLLPGKGTGGEGLCNEFSNQSPPGFDNAAPGECFPKIGVGLLTRIDEKPYNFFLPYPVTPFSVHTTASAESVRFVSEPRLCRGYAMSLEKEIKIRGRELTISYTLHNVGSKPIVTNEYVHNFIAIDYKPIGPDYVLRFPGIVRPREEVSEHKRRALHIEHDKIHWNHAVSDTFYCKMSGFQEQTPFYWELVHKSAGVGIRERGSEPVAWLALWGESHVVSPEVFVHVEVSPAETRQWNRTFDFFVI